MKAWQPRRVRIVVLELTVPAVGPVGDPPTTTLSLDSPGPGVSGMFIISLMKGSNKSNDNDSR